jgi:hypothetical protein
MTVPCVLCVCRGEFKLGTEEAEVSVMVCKCLVVYTVSVSVPGWVNRGVEVALGEKVGVMGFRSVTLFPYLRFKFSACVRVVTGGRHIHVEGGEEGGGVGEVNFKG